MKTIKVTADIHRQIKIEAAKRGINMIKLIKLAVDLIAKQGEAKQNK